MDCADRVADGSVAEFFASLFLNLAKSHEDSGNLKQARRLYECAAEKLALVPAGGYRDLVEDGIHRSLQRVGDSRDSV